MWVRIGVRSQGIMMPERIQQDARGAILCDAAVSSQVDNDWFAPDYWRGRGALRMQAGGRGGVAIIASPLGECVLRHYRRGGLVQTLLGHASLATTQRYVAVDDAKVREAIALRSRQWRGQGAS